MLASAVSSGAYIRSNVATAFLWRLPGSVVRRPYPSSWATATTGVPGATIARGKPWPNDTPVTTFCLPGSISRIALPSHPSPENFVGSAVCQMSIERKCDRSGSGYPIPCTTATFPLS